MTVQTQNQMTPQDVVMSVAPEFAKLAQGHNAVKWEAEANYAIQQLYKNDFAVKTAQRNPVSVQNAVRNVAAIGLTLNPANKYAYLVPRDGAICLDVSYMGLMHLAQDTGSIMWAQCKIVCENDQYQNKGASKEPEHAYSAFGDRGEIVGAYCVAKTADGDFLTHEMPIADIYAIRDRSMAWKKGQSGPWKTDEKEMIKKTVVKQASKYWPKVERMQKAIEMVNTESGEGIDFESEQNQIQYDPAEDAARLLAAFDQGDWAAWQNITRTLDEYQMSKLFKAPHVNTKMRQFAQEANRTMFELKATIQGMIQSEDDEALVEAWNELTPSERECMRRELPPEQVQIARAWVLADKEAQNQ
jgi:recombination protein RecT